MTTTNESAIGPRVRQFRVDPSWIVVAVVLLPLLATFISLLGTHWHPAAENALELLRIGDVGTRHTPLVGAQSRFQWDHPGPMLFWILAPFHWIAGDTAVLVGVLCINAAAIVGALFLARRRGGLAATFIVAIVILLLMRAFEPRVLLDVWNPSVALFPFLAYLVCCWSVADGDLPVLPWLAGVGSFLVQAHVGYSPLVAGAGVIALGTLAVMAARGARKLEHLRRWSGVTAVVAVVLWTPSVIQQFTGDPGNLGEILNSFRHPKEPMVGLATSLGIMGGELGHRMPWISGNDETLVGFVRTGAILPAVCLLALVLVLGVLAMRRGEPAALALAVVAVGVAVCGVIAGARIIGIAAGYLLRWWWVIAAMVWCSVAFSLWQLLAERVNRRMAAGIASAALAVLTAVVVTDALPAHPPEESYSVAIGKLAPPTEAALDSDRQYFVDYLGHKDFGAVGVGVYYYLYERGYDVKVDRRFEYQYNAWRVGDRDAADATITTVTSDELDLGWEPPAGSTLLAEYDSLDPAARARASELEQEIRSKIPPGSNLTSMSVDFVLSWGEMRRLGISQDTIEELRALRRRGVAYQVWLTPH